MTSVETSTYLLSSRDSGFREDDDLDVPVDLDRLGDAVGVAAVVDVPGEASLQRRVDHAVLVEAEHVDPTILRM